MDDERQQVLNAGARVTQVYLFRIDLCNDEDELDHDEGYQANDSSCVVVEEEQLGLVECFSCLHQALVLGLDNVCLLYTSPSPRDQRGSRMPSSA